MGKEHSGKSPAGRPPKSADIAQLRTAIDKIDRDLVGQLTARAKLVQEIGKLKEAADVAPFVPAREEEILARIQELNRGPLSPDSLRAIFREIISGSRRLEKQLRVAFLGPQYTYSHLATLHRFGHGVDLVPVGSIAAVFEEVDRKQADFGVVPIENSTDGRITDTLDMFTRLPIRICSEVQLRIHHTLLGRCPRGEVTEIYSKAQPLSQCRNWLAKHMPAARTIEVTSTGMAAQVALDKPGAAAIASVEAGQHYGLDVLAEKIEDNPDNITRFAVIGADSAARSGRDKTAAMFQIEHRPGSLAEAIAIFKRNRLNLTWIESFPIARGEYLFFIEFDGHQADLKVRRALQSLGKKTLRLEILGSFPRTEPVG